MAASGAKAGFGTAFQLSDGGGTPVYTTIAEVVSIGGPSISRTAIDVTHFFSDDGWREYIGGLPDGGEVTFGLNFIATNATQVDLITNVGQQTASSIVRGYRLVFPDSATSLAVTFVTTTGTTTAHGWSTAQPVRLSTSGTLPTGFTAGKWYFARRLSTTTFSVHPTGADAVADTNAISASGGSGTHTIYSGAMLTFSALCNGFVPAAEIDAQIKADVTLKVSGKVTLTPA